jgi:hypothetical protein
MATYSEIADKILATYNSKIDSMEPYRKFHWFVRCYRITGDNKYSGKIYSAFTDLKPQILISLNSLKSGETILASANEKISRYEVNNKRKIKRFNVYKKNPSVMVHMEALTYLFDLKSLGLTEAGDIKGLYNMSLNYYRENDVSAIFLTREFIEARPSEAANMIYFLAYLGISDNIEEFLSISKEYWQSVNPESHDIWLDKVYALTHIVIAASQYYQNFAERKGFEWIFDYFEKNIEGILTNCSADAIAEVGLSFKLTGEFDNKTLGSTKDHLVSAFNEKIGYIAKNTEQGIGLAGHRNILAVMVLKDFKELYKGPNLGEIV